MFVLSSVMFMMLFMIFAMWVFKVSMVFMVIMMFIVHPAVMFMMVFNFIPIRIFIKRKFKHGSYSLDSMFIDHFSLYRGQCILPFWIHPSPIVQICQIWS